MIIVYIVLSEKEKIYKGKGVSCDIKDRLIASSLAHEWIFIDKTYSRLSIVHIRLPPKAGTGD